MPSFVWKGKNRFGAFQEGILIADTRDAATAILRRQNVQLTSIKEKGRELRLIPKFPSGVGAKRVAIFTRQFSVMIDAGLPLVQCLEILGTQQENKTFARILQQTRMDVEGGASLADAMRKHPKAFDDLFTNMIAAGEAGGILDTILKRLATYIEKAVKLKAQVKSAMIYPVAVLVIAAAVEAVILWKVIPTFAALFAGLGAQLPLPTRLVIAASNFLANYIVFIVAAIAVAILTFFKGADGTSIGQSILDAIGTAISNVVSGTR